jgi:hypothetical protein
MATECFGSIRRAAPGEFSGCITLREVLDSRRYRKQRRHADTSLGAWRRYLLGTEIERAERRR